MNVASNKSDDAMPMESLKQVRPPRFRGLNSWSSSNNNFSENLLFSEELRRVHDRESHREQRSGTHLDEKVGRGQMLAFGQQGFFWHLQRRRPIWMRRSRTPVILWPAEGIKDRVFLGTG